jgi:hypothetical protein
MIDPEQKRQEIQKYVKYGAYAIGAALIAPWVYAGAVNLIEAMWAVVGVVVSGAVIWAVAPAAADYIANKRIQLIVAVAEANPIETMKELFSEKSQQLDAAENNITDFETELGTFSDKVEMFKKKYPEKAPAYINIQSKMQECLDGMRNEQSQATKELAQFKDKITEAEALFDMAKAANKMLAKSQSAQAAVFADIKEQVSFDVVRSNLNRAFANLNTAVERRKNAAAFTGVRPEAISAPTPAIAALPAAPVAVSASTVRQREVAGARR